MWTQFLKSWQMNSVALPPLSVSILWKCESAFLWPIFCLFVNFLAIWGKDNSFGVSKWPPGSGSRLFLERLRFLYFSALHSTWWPCPWQWSHSCCLCIVSQDSDSQTLTPGVGMLGATLRSSPAKMRYSCVLSKYKKQINCLGKKNKNNKINKYPYFVLKPWHLLQWVSTSF